MKTEYTLDEKIWRYLGAEDRHVWNNRPALRRQVTVRAGQYQLILQLLADGLIYKQIEPEIGLSFRTVQAYVQSMMKATGATGVTHLTAIALREGLIK